MDKSVFPPPSGQLGNELRGTWWLVSREDRAADGTLQPDPVLGSNPLGIVCYAIDHFAAQFMRRDRTGEIDSNNWQAGQNNTRASGGYDAYFGTYEVNEETGTVAHTLAGSVEPSNIGLTVSRELRVIGNELVIRLQTTSVKGIPVTRILRWTKIS